MQAVQLHSPSLTITGYWSFLLIKWQQAPSCCSGQKPGSASLSLPLLTSPVIDKCSTLSCDHCSSLPSRLHLGVHHHVIRLASHWYLAPGLLICSPVTREIFLKPMSNSVISWFKNPLFLPTAVRIKARSNVAL